MIEVKLSQGAKPGKGGILPAEKVTTEIAKIRGIPIGETCVSPNNHSSFSNVERTSCARLITDGGKPANFPTWMP